MSPAAPARITLAPETRVIADLHLDPERGPAWQAFERWLAALEAPALLVLGDLFEYWTGAGQARDPAYAGLFRVMRARAEGGLALHFLHGNRDFLLEERFARAAGGQVHPHGLLGRTAGGQELLFLHGDELATRDRSYQRLRRVLRSGPVRALARSTPAPLSAALARALRRRSRRAVAAKPATTVELQREAAEALCARHAAAALVCGHAHRYRREVLAGGQTWIVLDAFGGEHDVLRLASTGELVLEASRLQAAGAQLSSRASMIIALDGPAGVGKSAVARRLADELGIAFLDTGAMYRAVTLSVLERGIDPHDPEGCAGVARELRLDFDAHGHVRLDGRAGEPAVRGAAVTAAVSHVSAHPGVRTAVVARQRSLAAEWGALVAEGRDTTTVVFPDASHKFYLWASPAERARRRALQENALARTGEIQVEIERRDALDSTRALAPLRQAEDATRIETDGLDLAQVVARLLAHVRGDA